MPYYPPTPHNSRVIAVRGVANQSVLTGTITPVVYNSVTVDSMGEYDNATGVFTAKVSGFYQINGLLFMAGLSAGNSLTISIYKNGSEYDRIQRIVAAGDNGIEINEMVQLAASDTLGIRVFQNSGGTLNIYSTATVSGTTLSIIRIG